MQIENSFLPVRGVGETTERRLWEHGITHWDEFDGSVVGSTVADRIEIFIDDGRRHLEAGDVSPFAEALPAASRWRFFENVRDDVCYLDIETTGLDASRHDVTTVSVHRRGETRTYVNGQDLTRDRLQSEFDDAAALVTFNGQRFDVPFLETAFDVDASVPHIDLMYPCRKLDLTGGLKRIERDLGIDRDQPDISGRDAVRLWHQYERGDEDALETLVRYNRADTANLEPLMETVAERLHESVFEPVCGRSLE
ncbi:ribonuclease H-like domain-containing protein [Saliphagus sp. GCM10025334]